MRIILVDDHAIVREGVRAILESHDDMQVVGEFANGTDALAAAAGLSPHLALVDLKMPGLSCVETIRGLHERVPGIRVLVFTSFGEDSLIRATLDAGATGFLIKDALKDDLLKAIRSVAAGQPYLAPAQRQLIRFAQPWDERKRSRRETDVLRLIAEGLSNKHIARRLNDRRHGTKLRQPDTGKTSSRGPHAGGAACGAHRLVDGSTAGAPHPPTHVTLAGRVRQFTLCPAFMAAACRAICVDAATSNGATCAHPAAAIASSLLATAAFAAGDAAPARDRLALRPPDRYRAGKLLGASTVWWAAPGSGGGNGRVDVAAPRRWNSMMPPACRA